MLARCGDKPQTHSLYCTQQAEFTHVRSNGGGSEFKKTSDTHQVSLEIIWNDNCCLKVHRQQGCGQEGAFKMQRGEKGRRATVLLEKSSI